MCSAARRKCARLEERIRCLGALHRRRRACDPSAPFRLRQACIESPNRSSSTDTARVYDAGHQPRTQPESDTPSLIALKGSTMKKVQTHPRPLSRQGRLHAHPEPVQPHVCIRCFAARNRQLHSRKRRGASLRGVGAGVSRRTRRRMGRATAAGSRARPEAAAYPRRHRYRADGSPVCRHRQDALRGRRGSKTL